MPLALKRAVEKPAILIPGHLRQQKQRRQRVGVRDLGELLRAFLQRLRGFSGSAPLWCAFVFASCFGLIIAGVCYSSLGSTTRP